MFERYTEKARRVIFFARYEASQFGSPYIETEHLLLAILRETASIKRLLPPGATESIRAQVEAQTTGRDRIRVSVDLPLSNEVKRVLTYGADEAERLHHRHIGSEHLFLGLLREEGCFAEKLLEPFGVKLEPMRSKIEIEGAYDAAEQQLLARLKNKLPEQPAITIHGRKFGSGTLRRAISRCREYNWHWQKTLWKPRDVVIHRKSHKVSFDLSLATDTENYDLVKAGWTKDHCDICQWELFESKDEADHGTGYTNGRDWVCTECYEKFWSRPDFISGAYSDIT